VIVECIHGGEGKYMRCFGVVERKRMEVVGCGGELR